MLLTHYLHEFDKGRSHGEGIDQHVKMPRMKSSARPPCSLRLLQKVAICLSEQYIAAGSIGPPGYDRHTFLKKAEGTRLHFCQQMLASKLIGKVFAQVLVAPVWKTLPRGQILVQLLSKFRNTGLHLIQLALTRMGQTRIDKDVCFDWMSGCTGDDRQQGTSSTMTNQRQGALFRD